MQADCGRFAAWPQRQKSDRVTRRILVTGGAGFIGSHLVECLRVTGARVDVIDNLVRGRPAWLPRKTSLHAADIREPVPVQRVIKEVRPDVVVHLAAMHFIPHVDDAPDLAWDVNVAGTRNLLLALSAHPPEILLFASTAAVYPDREGPIPESCPVGPIDLYGKTKLEGERLVASFGAETGTKCLLARIFNVIGKRETNAHIVPELVEQLRQGRSPVRLGNLSTRRDYTDVVDVAEALARLLEPTMQEAGVFNVGSGRATSVAELVDVCEHILGQRITVEIDSRRLRAQDRNELVADISLLQRAIGSLPRRSLRSTLTELLAKH